MKVKIIEEECTGCEECVDAVPDVFEMSEDGPAEAIVIE
jgi:ferredoxin